MAFSGDLSVEVETYTVAAIGELTYDATEFEPWVLTDDADPGDDEALVRLAHASPDAPNVDVTVTDGETTLFEDVGYSEASDYVSVPDGSYTLEVRPADGDDGAEPVAEFDVDVTTGCTYTAFAEGYLTPDDEPLDEPFDLVVAVDGA